MSPFAKERAAAIRAVELASKVCTEVFNSLNYAEEVSVKTDQSPVSIADYAAQAIIIETIRRELADDTPFMGEEDATLLRLPSAKKMCCAVTALVRKVYGTMSQEEVLENIDRGASEGGGRRCWVLDPIDGTKGFIAGRQYAICLGLIVDGQAVLGVLGCPNYDPLTAAAVSHGSSSTVASKSESESERERGS